MSVQIINGDCRSILPTLEAGSVQCCVTSPPYYGLRDYGVDGQIGLEPTPDEYVAEMVAVFREVRRVLRDDGTLFLNIGDSYRASGPTTGGASPKSTLGGGGGRYRAGSKAEAMFNASRGDVPRAASYGKRDKAPANSLASDCLCGSLCGACRAAYRIGKSHSGSLRVPTLDASTLSSTPARRGSQSDHLPTSDFAGPENRSATAILDPAHYEHLGPVPHPASPASMIGGYAPPLQAGHLRCGICGVGLSETRLPSRDAHPSSDTTACTCDTEMRSAPSSRDTLGTASSDLAYPSSSTKSLIKSKDLLGIPWLLAFALRADGWYLRSDIIWHKPNPMPESIKDRPTSAHEHVFLLSKGPRYFYDAAAIAEPSEYPGDDRHNRTDTRKAIDAMCADGGRRARTGNPTGDTRNARNVWTIATQPFSGAHFATMPPELAERCIKAGTKPGDTVLDPFGGAGTTGLVADRLGRSAKLIELNPAYRDLAAQRVNDDAPLFGAVI